MPELLRKLTELVRLVLNDERTVLDPFWAEQYILGNASFLKIKNQSEKDWFEITLSRKVWDSFLKGIKFRYRITSNPAYQS